jgi:probable HAF family extracellular repeat protein
MIGWFPSPSEVCATAEPSSLSREHFWFTDLGTLGGLDSFPYDVNARGQVIGVSRIADGSTSHGFFWEHGVMTDLGSLSYASAINDRGEVAGSVAGHATVWREGLVGTDLGTLGGAESGANAIAEDGAVVGTAQTTDGAMHAALWAWGVTRDLGTLGGDFSEVTAINASGQIIGISSTAVAGVQRAFFWDRGVMTDLGSFGGWLTVPHALNEQGQVVGFSLTEAGVSHAFSWDRGVLLDLGTLGGDASDALAINDSGQVVVSWLKGASEQASVWDAGAVTPLGTLGGSWTAARAIDEEGRVVGTAETADGKRQAFVWLDGAFVALPGGAAEASVASHVGASFGNRSIVVGNVSGVEGTHAVLWRSRRCIFGGRWH